MASKHLLIFLSFTRRYNRSTFYAGDSSPIIWFAWLRGIQTGMGFASSSYSSEMDNLDQWFSKQDGFDGIDWYSAGLRRQLSPELFSQLMTDYANNELNLSDNDIDSIHPYDYDD